MTRNPLVRHHLGRPWCEAIELSDGRRFILRPMQSLDASGLRESFRTLSPEEVRMRFMHPIKELTEQYAEQLATIDSDREFALVLVEARHPATARIVGVVRAAMDDDEENAEFAIIIGGDLKGHGLGRHMLSKAIDWTRKKGLKSIYGFVLNDNAPMLGLARSLGFSAHPAQDESGVVEVRLNLT